MKIRPKGPGRWQLVWELGRDPATGRRRQKTQIVEAKTLKEAQRLWVAEQARLQAEGPRPAGRRRTVADALDGWLAHVATTPVSARTHEFYRYLGDRFVRPTLGSLPLDRVTVGDVRQAVDTWRQWPQQSRRRLPDPDQPRPPVSPRTVQAALLVTKMLFDWAVEGEWLARNPAQRLTVSVPRRAPTWWDAETAQRFLAAVRDHRWAPAFWLGLMVGLRLGEVLGLRWQDVDVAAGTLTVQHVMKTRQPVTFGPPKTDAGRRTLPVDPDTLAVLQAHRRRQDALRAEVGSAWEAHDLVLTTSTGRWLMPRSLEREFDRLQEAVGVPRIRFHDLRHSQGSLLMAAGVPLRIIADRLGHTDPAFTARVYTHANLELQREWMTRAFARRPDPRPLGAAPPDAPTPPANPAATRPGDESRPPSRP